MKVTIITVTYNSAKFLQDCIDSVIDQTYPEIEHIVIDAKSTDGTLEIIKRYENHTSPYLLQKPRW